MERKRTETSSGVEYGPNNDDCHRHTDVERPKRPEFKNVAARIATFKEWPTSISQSPRDLADAGFFYTGFGDRVRCYQCGGGLRNWQPGDDPWIEHARWYSGCSYIRTCKGDEFVELIQQIKDLEDFASGIDKNEKGLTKTPVVVLQENALESVPCLAVLQMGYDAEVVNAAVRAYCTLNGSNNFTATDLLQIILDNEEGNEKDTSASLVHAEDKFGSNLPDQETNFARFSAAVTELGRDALWNLLIDQILPKFLPSKILANKDIHLSPDQQKVLCPPANQRVDPNQATVVALYTVLRYCCASVYMPAQGWCNEPTDDDLGIGDDIQRIALMIDKLLAHTPACRLSQTEFNFYWGELEAVLSRISSSLRTSSLLLKLDQWKAREMDREQKNWCKGQLKKMDSEEKRINRIEKRVEDIESQLKVKEIQDLAKSLLEENRQLKKQTKCRICLERAACVVLLPCSHMVSCAGCALSTIKCPSCETLVKGTVKAYLP